MVSIHKHSQAGPHFLDTGFNFNDRVAAIVAVKAHSGFAVVTITSRASQFFIHKDIGTCSYSVMNVKASNTAVQLAQEDVSYTINNRATILMPIEGSSSSGFSIF